MTDICNTEEESSSIASARRNVRFALSSVSSSILSNTIARTSSSPLSSSAATPPPSPGSDNCLTQETPSEVHADDEVVCQSNPLSSDSSEERGSTPHDPKAPAIGAISFLVRPKPELANAGKDFLECSISSCGSFLTPSQSPQGSAREMKIIFKGAPPEISTPSSVQDRGRLAPSRIPQIPLKGIHKQERAIDDEDDDEADDGDEELDDSVFAKFTSLMPADFDEQARNAGFLKSDVGIYFASSSDSQSEGKCSRLELCRLVDRLKKLIDKDGTVDAQGFADIGSHLVTQIEGFLKYGDQLENEIDTLTSTLLEKTEYIKNLEGQLKFANEKHDQEVQKLQNAVAKMETDFALDPHLHTSPPSLFTMSFHGSLGLGSRDEYNIPEFRIKQFHQLVHEVSSLKAENATLREQLEESEKVVTQLETVQEAERLLSEENNRLKADTIQAHEELNKIRLTLTGYVARIEELEMTTRLQKQELEDIMVEMEERAMETQLTPMVAQESLVLGSLTQSSLKVSGFPSTSNKAHLTLQQCGGLTIAPAPRPALTLEALPTIVVKEQQSLRPTKPRAKRKWSFQKADSVFLQSARNQSDRSENLTWTGAVDVEVAAVPKPSLDWHSNSQINVLRIPINLKWSEIQKAVDLPASPSSFTFRRDPCVNKEVSQPSLFIAPEAVNNVTNTATATRRPLLICDASEELHIPAHGALPRPHLTIDGTTDAMHIPGCREPARAPLSLSSRLDSVYIPPSLGKSHPKFSLSPVTVEELPSCNSSRFPPRRPLSVVLSRDELYIPGSPAPKGPTLSISTISAEVHIVASQKISTPQSLAVSVAADEVHIPAFQATARPSLSVCGTSDELYISGSSQATSLPRHWYVSPGQSLVSIEARPSRLCAGPTYMTAIDSETPIFLPTQSPSVSIGTQCSPKLVNRESIGVQSSPYAAVSTSRGTQVSPKKYLPSARKQVVPGFLLNIYASPDPPATLNIPAIATKLPPTQLEEAVSDHNPLRLESPVLSSVRTQTPSWLPPTNFPQFPPRVAPPSRASMFTQQSSFRHTTSVNTTQTVLSPPLPEKAGSVFHHRVHTQPLNRPGRVYTNSPMTSTVYTPMMPPATTTTMVVPPPPSNLDRLPLVRSFSHTTHSRVLSGDNRSGSWRPYDAVSLQRPPARTSLQPSSTPTVGTCRCGCRCCCHGTKRTMMLPLYTMVTVGGDCQCGASK